MMRSSGGGSRAVGVGGHGERAKRKSRLLTAIAFRPLRWWDRTRPVMFVDGVSFEPPIGA